jgi:hypothetical protein
VVPGRESAEKLTRWRQEDAKDRRGDREDFANAHAEHIAELRRLLVEQRDHTA